MKRLAVYCGSASPADARYVGLARDVGAELARRGIGVVYGGGRMGLMGALAEGALAAGGKVTGVIPERLVDAELANHACTELIVVPGMHERKLAFTELSDGFLSIMNLLIRQADRTIGLLAPMLPFENQEWEIYRFKYFGKPSRRPVVDSRRLMPVSPVPNR